MNAWVLFIIAVILFILLIVISVLFISKKISEMTAAQNETTHELLVIRALHRINQNVFCIPYKVRIVR